MNESKRKALKARARSEEVAELLERCAGFAARGGRVNLAAEVQRHAAAVRAEEMDAIAQIDALFAGEGPLQKAAVLDGWDEEYVGLAAAYRVESAGLR